jgi:threonine/homoserine/homoserine lactone efflux protein
MTVDLLIALVTFAIVTSVSPGPNNTMVLASGVNFGVWRSVPHMLGVGLGFALMLAIIGLGLGRVFVAYPVIYTVMKIAGAIYMLWLAWKIANAGPMAETESAGTPMTFIQAVLFQWVNPKAWVIAITANATYSIMGHPVLSALMVAGTFLLVSGPSSLTWVFFGSLLRKLLSNPKTLHIFNITMAVLLVLSLVPLVWN